MQDHPHDDYISFWESVTEEVNGDNLQSKRGAASDLSHLVCLRSMSWRLVFEEVQGQRTTLAHHNVVPLKVGMLGRVTSVQAKGHTNLHPLLHPML